MARRLRSHQVTRFALLSILLVSLSVAFVPRTSRAAGAGGGSGSVTFTKGKTTPGQQAIGEYKTAGERLDRARKYQQEIVEARAEGDTKRVEKLEERAARQYRAAEKHLRKAIKYDEELFQAWSSLGYTLRRMGRYDDALEAYDRAIALEPRYVEAVEYRAEAYVELGRFEEAQQEYVKLVGWVRPMAAQLMAKMEAWASAHSADPGPFDPAEVAAFSAWIAERKAIDGDLGSFTAAERASW